MDFKEMGLDSYPLSWPVGWKRETWRKPSKFKTSFAVARDQLFRELKLLGARVDTRSWEAPQVILSSNVPLRRDGLPLAGQSNPKDPGIAVYFKLDKKAMVFACDQYLKVEENLYAITKTIEALRGIKRWGASDMMERSFTGFQALPPPKSNWWEILEVPQSASAEQIKDAWRRLAGIHHPDRGGSNEMMSKINKAYEEATR